MVCDFQWSVTALENTGFADARVDRIAAAGCNKKLIYHYFGDKQGLYDAVQGRVVLWR